MTPESFAAVYNPLTRCHCTYKSAHDAKAAIRRAGLIPWAHLGTQEPHA